MTQAGEMFLVVAVYCLVLYLYGAYDILWKQRRKNREK